MDFNGWWLSHLHFVFLWTFDWPIATCCFSSQPNHWKSQSNWSCSVWLRSGIRHRFLLSRNGCCVPTGVLGFFLKVDLFEIFWFFFTLLIDLGKSLKFSVMGTLTENSWRISIPTSRNDPHSHQQPITHPKFTKLSDWTDQNFTDWRAGIKWKSFRKSIATNIPSSENQHQSEILSKISKTAAKWNTSKRHRRLGSSIQYALLECLRSHLSDKIYWVLIGVPARDSF